MMMKKLSLFHSGHAPKNHLSVRHAFAMAAILAGFLATSPTAVASAYVQGTYSESCVVVSTTLCSTPPNLFGIPQGPSFTYDNRYHGEGSYPFEPGNFTTADTHLFVSVSPGSFHAIGETAASLQMSLVHGLPQVIAFGTVQLYVDSFDVIHFTSGTLAVGTPVSYEITGVLDSTLTGACDSSGGNPPGAFAALSIAGVTQAGDLYHSTCGDGSDHMTVTRTLMTSVGGSLPLQFNFQIASTSGIGTAAAFATSAHSVNAANSGMVYINVLTPGVDLTSDSGYSYAPAAAVPEPPSGVVIAGGLLLAVLSSRRRR
jgi:hypothetical protein